MAFGIPQQGRLQGILRWTARASECQRVSVLPPMPPVDGRRPEPHLARQKRARWAIVAEVCLIGKSSGSGLPNHVPSQTDVRDLPASWPGDGFLQRWWAPGGEAAIPNCVNSAKLRLVLSANDARHWL